MRRVFAALLSCSLVCALAGRAAAEDAKAIIERAAKAHGGVDKLAAVKATHTKAKGVMSVMGQEFSFVTESLTVMPDKGRESIELDVMGQKVTVKQIINGGKAWVVSPAGGMELEGGQRDELLEGAYMGRIMYLAPLLKEPGFEFTALGAGKAGDKDAVGVKIASKGHKDVSLWFDKDTGLIAKVEREGLDDKMAKVKQEILFSDYKEFNGLKLATKVSATNDGKKFMTVEMTSMEFPAAIDDKEFAAP